MRWPSRRMASSRFIPATSGSRWCCRGWPRRWGGPKTSIVMKSYLLGGGFGRRLNGDYAGPARRWPRRRSAASRSSLFLRAPTTSRFDSSPLPLGADRGQHGVRRGRQAGSPPWSTCRLRRAGRREAMAPFFMPKGDQRRGLRSLLRSAAPTTGTRWAPSGCGDLQRTGQPDLPAGLAALRGPRLDQLGGGKLHGRGGPHARADPLAFRLKLLDASGRNSGRVDGLTAVGGAKPPGRGAGAGWRRRPAGARTPAANTGLGIATTFGQERDMPTWVGLRRPRPRRSQDRRGKGREADPGRRRRRHRASRTARSPRWKAPRSGA